MYAVPVRKGVHRASSMPVQLSGCVHAHKQVEEQYTRPFGHHGSARHSERRTWVASHVVKPWRQVQQSPEAHGIKAGSEGSVDPRSVGLEVAVQ